MTPYEKLKSLTDAAQYLKSEITFTDLDKIAYAQSDIEYAKIMQTEKYQMLKTAHTNP